MTAHGNSSPDSRKLCDLLFSSVKNDLNGVTRNEAQKCCSIGVGTRCAYAYHRRDGVRVYLRGKVADGSALKALAGPGLSVEQRVAMGSPWARLSPYYLDLDNEREVVAALPLLLYAANQLKGRDSRNYLLPSEESANEMLEGTRITVQVSRIERDPKARKSCLQIFGTRCLVCGLDFGVKYGEDIGSGFIHVHHLDPLANATGRRKVNPEKDLRPVCPNCHEMLHRKKPPLSMEELRARILK